LNYHSVDVHSNIIISLEALRSEGICNPILSV